MDGFMPNGRAKLGYKARFVFFFHHHDQICPLNVCKCDVFTGIAAGTG